MKKIFNNISPAQIIIEFISVVFAVLLALGLNSYKETKSMNSEAQKLRAAVLNEFRTNKVKIDSIILVNQDYFNYLDSLVKLDKEQVTFVQFQYDLDLLTSAAWDLTQGNQATSLLSQKFLLEAAELYQAQDFFTSFTSEMFKTVGQLIHERESTPPYNTAVTLYYNMNILMNAAKDLSYGYDTFLKDFSENW